MQPLYIGHHKHTYSFENIWYNALEDAALILFGSSRINGDHVALWHCACYAPEMLVNGPVMRVVLLKWWLTDLKIHFLTQVYHLSLIITWSDFNFQICHQLRPLLAVLWKSLKCPIWTVCTRWKQFMYQWPDYSSSYLLHFNHMDMLWVTVIELRSNPSIVHGVWFRSLIVLILPIKSTNTNKKPIQQNCSLP